MLYCDSNIHIKITVFHAQAPSNKALGSPTNMYNSHERQKKNLYNKRIVEVEHGTFTPIVLSTTGGMGREAHMFFKKLADKLSRKSGQRYSEAMTFIRKRIRFDLLRTTVIALRGERGLKSSIAVKIADLDINLEPVL